jgi:MFS family permease
MTQGFLYGIGSSMLYFPFLATAPEYFSTRRGAAVGTILSAAGMGGLALTPLTSHLLGSIGARWTLRLLAVLNLALGMPLALVTPTPRTRTRRPTLVNVRLARKPAFVLATLAATLQASGNLVPLTFLVQFARALGWGAGFGATLLALSNGVNSASRIGMGLLADRVGRQNTLVFSVVASAVCVMGLWMGAAVDAANGKALFIAFVVLYGITAGGMSSCSYPPFPLFSLGGPPTKLLQGRKRSSRNRWLTILGTSGYNALLPTTITDVFGIQAYASINGIFYFVRGCGALFGSPVGGAILGTAGGTGPDALHQFRAVIWYAGALLLGSSFCAAGVRGFDAVEKGKWRWRA